MPRASPLHPAEMVAHNGGESGGSDPFHPSKCATGEGEMVRPYGHTISPPFLGVLPSTSIPAGRLSSWPGSQLEEQQTTDGPRAERGKVGGCTQPDISDPEHGQLATLLDSLGLRVDIQLTCPPTS